MSNTALFYNNVQLSQGGTTDDAKEVLYKKGTTDAKPVEDAIDQLDQFCNNLDLRNALAITFQGTTDSTGDVAIPYSWLDGYIVLSCYSDIDNRLCNAFHGAGPNYIHVSSFSGEPIANTSGTFYAVLLHKNNFS